MTNLITSNCYRPCKKKIRYKNAITYSLSTIHKSIYSQICYTIISCEIFPNKTPNLEVLLSS
jgi:hypothetical protein